MCGGLHDGHDLRHAKGVDIAFRVGDGHIFSFPEDMRVEMKPGFIVASTGGAVMDAPSGAVRAAGSMSQHAELVVFAPPEMTDAAAIAQIVPGLRIEMAASIQRRENFVSARITSRRELSVAGEI